MKIAVIGANGKSGQAFVDEAVQRGHQVRAGIFRDRGYGERENVTYMQCDATVPEDVEKLVKGCDAVVSLIGHVKGSPAFLQTTAMTNILSAMDRYGIKRLVSLTGTGVRDKNDMPSLADKIVNTAIETLDPARIRDGKAHVDVIKESAADWTVLRVLKLTDMPYHAYYLTDHGPGRTFVSRASVAAAIVNILVDGLHKKSMPIVSRNP